MSGVLVAGVGDVFMADDGFGVEVVRRLRALPVPTGVTIADFGIRGIHLAYELLEGYDRLVLVDAVTRGGRPGSVYVLEPDEIPASGAVADAHSMQPTAVFSYLAAIGGTPVPTLIVGCEPASLEERMSLSEPVELAVAEAVSVILDLLSDPSTFATSTSATSPPTSSAPDTTSATSSPAPSAALIPAP